MLGHVTIGQYVPGQTIIHRLNPSIKILITLLSAVGIFIQPGLWGLAVSSLYIALVVLFINQLFFYLFRGLRPLLLLIALTFTFQAFTIPGDPLLTIGYFDISKQGLQRAVIYMGRLVLVVIMASVLTATTTPIALTQGLEKILSPLKRFGVPAHELAMMMTIALRFIPTLLNEADIIIKAQRSRGAGFNQGGITKRLQAIVPFLVPLLATSLRRAEELATAMDSRCYRGGLNRTTMTPLTIGPQDYMAVTIAVIFLLLALTHRLGW
ncbi:energy-coupling factor transporter transmembrane component T [Peptococcaceae bacterium 1198_IL3148]